MTSKDRSVGRLMTEIEAAERLTLSSATLRKWRAEGRGPTFLQLGRRVRYSEDAIERWLRRQERL